MTDSPYLSEQSVSLTFSFGFKRKDRNEAQVTEELKLKLATTEQVN